MCLSTLLVRHTGGHSPDEQLLTLTHQCTYSFSDQPAFKKLYERWHITYVHVQGQQLSRLYDHTLAIPHFQ